MHATKSFILLLAFLIPAIGNTSDEYWYQEKYGIYQEPSAELMVLDGLIYRPLSLAGTLIGTGVFIVTLPFSLMGGNVDQAANRLIVEPASETFNRCLGCLNY